MGCVFLQKSVRKIVRSAAGLLKVGAAGHLVDGTVRLLNGRALQLAAQAGLDVGQILLPESLLLGGAPGTSGSELTRCWDGTLYQCKVYKGLLSDTKLSKFIQEGTV